MRWVALVAALLTFGPVLGAQRAPPARFQARPSGVRVAVESSRLRVMDGDTAEIRWSTSDVETVRVLGVDAPELFAHRGFPSAPTRLGMEARRFARGAFATARRIELLRASTLDRYRRTLGYFFLDGRNYSVLLLREGLGRETITRYGDNGFPREAAEVKSVARPPRSPR